MVTGRTALAGLTTVVAIGCATPAVERAPGAEPERTYLGAHDERPHLMPAPSAPPTHCPVEASTAGEAHPPELPLFSRTLVHLREDYPRDIAPRSRQLLVASLSAVGAADSDVVVNQDPDTPPRWVSITAKGERCTLNIERVDAPASLRSSLQDGMRFVGSRLALAGGETDGRLTKLEIAATNGLLAALDPQSRLIDVDTYRDIRAQRPGASAALAPPGLDADQAGPSLEEDSLGQEVAYLRPGRFQRGEGARVEQGATGSHGKTPKGVILDLRNNPGGLLDEAAQVADVFIERGVLGWIVGPHERKALDAHDDGHDFGGAVIVLVNHETAEGAELVASAIKNTGRGVILGEPTAGAGSVRAFFDLLATERPIPARLAPGSPDSDGARNVLDGREPPAPPEPAQADPTGVDQPEEVLGLLLRTGYLRTANDDSIEGAGVRPDIQPRWTAGPGPASNEDCLLELAQALISQAPDARRSTLLSTAKDLASKPVCGRTR